MSTGVTQNFSVPFPFIDKSHVHVCAIDPETRKKGTEYPIYEWIDTSTPKIKPINVLMIYRETPRDTPLVDFTNSQILVAEDLDLAVLQNLYICEEILDELGWQSNEIDLLWTAYNSLNTSHQALSEAVSALRTKLEETYDIAVRGFTIAQDACTWLKMWYEQFMPAISMFINTTIVDGGTVGIVDEIYCIVDGDIDPDEYDEAIIYDGSATADYHFAWTPEAIKLINAYDISEAAYNKAKQAEVTANKVITMLQALRPYDEQLEAVYDVITGIMSSGHTGQVFMRTADGYAWTDLVDIPVDPIN